MADREIDRLLARAAAAMAKELIRIAREHPELAALRQEAVDAGIVLQIVGVDFAALSVPMLAKADPDTPVPAGILSLGTLPAGQIAPAPRKKQRVTVNDRRFLKSLRISPD